MKVAITEMYPKIPWELVADPLISAKHTSGTTFLKDCDMGARSGFVRFNGGGGQGNEMKFQIHVIGG